jgi:hypothetical protein
MAWTYTIKRPVTPAEWRHYWHNWRMKAARRGVAAVYRVELQKRKVPHVHMTSWQVHEKGLAMIEEQLWFTRSWLDTITLPEADGHRIYDYAEWQHAVEGRVVDDHGGWAIYESLHSSKKGQSGWIGKHWGVIGRRYFKRREGVQLELTVQQYWRFRRLVSRWLKAAGTRRCSLPTHGKWLRCIPVEVSGRLVEFVKASP